MLEIQNLNVKYPGRRVLSGLNLSVPEGQLTVIIGPNGSGKSTLLKALAGILPCEGNIILDGSALHRMNNRERARKIGYLPQNRTVPEITAERLVLHGRFPYLSYPRTYTREDQRIVAQVMEELEITHLAGRLLPTLSGGERQKVYIAMVLAQRTPVVLMDEPTSYLDIAHRFETIRMAKELKQAGKTVLLVLHDLDLALGCADQIAVMKDGALEMYATPEEIFRSGVLERVFSVRAGRMDTKQGMQYYFQPQ